jgi:tetraacyldisaccharide 4'-kinase
VTLVRDAVRRLWSGELGRAGTVLNAILLPGEAAYGAAVRLRNAAYERGVLSAGRAAVPVISVGNLAVGGTGKTPFTHWLAVLLSERGRRPAVLHGGYGSDEPELHRRWAPDIPVFVGRNRLASAVEAVDRGCDVIVLDDAFQHRRLHRDLDIVLVAAERWFQPRRLLPRGPWREPGSALRRAGIIVVTRKTAPAALAGAVASELGSRAGGLPVIVAHLRAEEWRTGGGVVAGRPPAEPVLLVAGIAEPLLFEENVRQAGAHVADRVLFPDHHEYGEADAARILAAAGERQIVTTEKDWTKLQQLLPAERTWLLGQRTIVEHGEAILHDHLDRVLS